ncbi:MAG: MBL fold metallo-hydrolase [Planctomycetota bacterium]
MSECRFTLLDTGFCVHPEHVVLRNRRLRPMRFPALFALIEHPERGPILFDTGYGQPYVDAARSTWTGRIYNRVTPVTTSPDQFAAARCRERGVDPLDVSMVITSHFHADHVAGLVDFPRAEIVYLKSGWERVARLGPMRALTKGFLPSLIPVDFEVRSTPIEGDEWAPLGPEFSPFRRGVDLLGDGSLIVVALPGHAAGQLGIFVRRTSAPDVFMIADAAWTERGFKEHIMPSRVTRLLFDDMEAYRYSLGLIGAFHRLHPETLIVPSHCQATRDRLVQMPPSCHN